MTTDETRAAQHDIADVLVRYSTGIDRRDWDLFRSCFTADVVADYEGVATWHGVDEITKFMAEVHAGMGRTLHALSNMVIDVVGDRATARTYVDNTNMMPDGATGTHAVGYYDDELVRTPEGWRIARRHFVAVHLEGIGAS